MEPNSCLAEISHAEIQTKGKEESSSDVLIESPVLAQNLSTHEVRSSSDHKPSEVNPTMPIKEDKEEVVAASNDSLITSTQGLEKKVKVEPLTTESLTFQEAQNQKNPATESNYEVSQLFPGEREAVDFEAKEPLEALDLSLPKKKERNFRDRCVWITGDDGACESSLVMEVDEIEELTTGLEVEDDDDSCDSICQLEEMQEADMPVSDRASLSPPLDGAADEEMLLIDIEGVPYTLTPDGTKVPQADSEQAEQADPTSIVDNDQPSSSSALSTVVHSKQKVLHSSDGTTANIKYTAVKSNPVISNVSQLSVLPTLSNLPSQPLQVMANSTTNTPILLLPSSQLQASSTSSSSETKTGLMALSLPLGLAQNAQSSQMFFVLSSLPVSSTQSSATQLPVLAASSGQLSQITSLSSVALPLAANLSTVGSSVVASNPPVVNLLVPEPQCSSVSGSDKLGSPSPVAATTSPTGTSHVSSTSHTRKGSSSDKSDSWMPKSFREALLRPTSLSESATALPPDTQTQNPKGLSASRLPSKQPRSLPPALTSDVSDPGSPKVQRLPKAEREPVPESIIDSVSSQDEQLVSSSSPTPPVSPPGSANLSGNQPADLSPSSPNSGPRRILYCPYCPRVFYYLSDLERHSITHSQSKPHVCPLCGKAFKRSSHLERHKHIHTGQRNFVCPICSKRFREAGELQRHQRVHTGEKPFQCSLCHMRFAERNTLRRHTKRKHQGHEQEAMEADGGRAASSETLVLVEQEESAEWYSSEVPEQFSDSEADKDGE